MFMEYSCTLLKNICHMGISKHNLCNFDDSTDNVSKMFTSKSTPEEWDARGDEFYRRSLFNVAAKCYMKSGNTLKQKMSQAQQRAIDASNLKGTPKE